MNIKIALALLASSVASALAAEKTTPGLDKEAMPDAKRLEQMTARFAPTDLTADISKLTPANRRVLAKLIEASKIIDGIFLCQVWSGNVPMLLHLSRDQTAEGRARLHYFRLNRRYFKPAKPITSSWPRKAQAQRP